MSDSGTLPGTICETMSVSSYSDKATYSVSHLENENNQTSQGTETSSYVFAQPLKPCNLEQFDDSLLRYYTMRSLMRSYLPTKGEESAQICEELK